MVEAKPVRDSAKVTSTTELVPARQRERYTRKHRKLLCHYHFIIMTMIIVMIFVFFHFSFIVIPDISCKTILFRKWNT